MKSYKILLFSEDFPPYPGGIAQWAYGMAVSLQRAGHEVKIFTRNRDGIDLEQSFAGKLKLETIRGRNWKQFRTWFCYRTLRKELQNNGKPHLIIATTWNFSRGLIALTKSQQIPLVTVAHGLEVTRRMNTLKRFWLSYTLSGSERVIAVSRFTKSRILAGSKLRDEKILVLPNGIDPYQFIIGSDPRGLKQKYGIQDEQVLLTLARVIERKGHDDVIAALPGVIKATGPLKYIISGPIDPDYRRKLDKKISAHGLQKNVVFTGPVGHVEKIGLYKLCDLYIMPSKELKDAGDSEGFGITYLEANALGKAVIGGRSGGVAEAVIEGQTGLLVEPGNVKEISEKIVLLLGDEKLRNKLGDEGRRRIEQNLTWDRIAGDFITRVMGNGKADPQVEITTAGKKGNA